jgi:hypothetical protein
MSILETAGLIFILIVFAAAAIVGLQNHGWE